MDGKRIDKVLVTTVEKKEAEPTVKSEFVHQD
jgi:hypothetical protein